MSPEREDARAATRAFYARPDVLARYRGGTELTLAEQRLVARYLAPGSCVLDVGTGAGRVALALVRMGFRATGIDLSEDMLALAREAAAELRLDVDLLHGDAEALPFADDAFDGAIYACNGIGHLSLSGKAQALRELGRVTRPGGAVLLSARSPYALNRLLPGLVVRSARQLAGGPHRDDQNGQPYVHRPSVRTIEQLIRESGLELVESTSLRVLKLGAQPGRLTPYVGGQFYFAARVR